MTREEALRIIGTVFDSFAAHHLTVDVVSWPDSSKDAARGVIAFVLPQHDICEQITATLHSPTDVPVSDFREAVTMAVLEIADKYLLLARDPRRSVQ
jgi:hypothetical protein